MAITLTTHISRHNKSRYESIITILNYGRRSFSSRDINDAALVAYAALSFMRSFASSRTLDGLAKKKSSEKPTIPSPLVGRSLVSILLRAVSRSLSLRSLGFLCYCRIHWPRWCLCLNVHGTWQTGTASRGTTSRFLLPRLMAAARCQWDRLQIGVRTIYQVSISNDTIASIHKSERDQYAQVTDNHTCLFVFDFPCYSNRIKWCSTRRLIPWRTDQMNFHMTKKYLFLISTFA